jgi:UrcA family protein
MNRSTTTRAGVAVALIAAAALIPALANATTSTVTAQTATETVKYGDLNLSHRGDARALVQRIRVAAQRVCMSTNSFASQQETCYQRAVTQALNEVSLKQHAATSSPASSQLL